MINVPSRNECDSECSGAYKKMESFILTQRQDGQLTFIVEDSGSGFTKEALLHGTEQFLWMTQQVEMAKPL